jgi:hypothetical protein
VLLGNTVANSPGFNSLAPKIHPPFNPSCLSIDPDDNLWTTGDGSHLVLELSGWSTRTSVPKTLRPRIASDIRERTWIPFYGKE